MKHYFSLFACLAKHGAAMVLCIASVGAHARDSDETPGMERAFIEAMEHYDQCRWSPAYANFAILADSGHVESARIALLMARHGSKLFGGPREASPSQIERWRRLSLDRMIARATGNN